MARSRCVGMDAIILRGEDDTEVEIEIELLGMLEPYFGGSWDEPPSGGGVDNLQAYHFDGKKRRPIELTKEEIKEFEDALAQQEMHDYEPPEFDYNL